MKNEERKGFTLVELLVVIAILAILATVSIIGYTSYIKKVSISNDNTLISQLNLALKAENASEDSKVLTETQLKAFIEKFTGQQYKDFGPQSSKYGYHIFFDIDNQNFVLSLLDEDPLINNEDKTLKVFNFDVFNADEIEERKEVKCNLKDNVFRNSIKDGFYFVDRNNSELSKIISIVEYPQSLDEYKEAIDRLQKQVEKAIEKEEIENNPYIQLQKALRSTVIMNEVGVFRYDPVERDDSGSVHVLICDNETGITLGNVLIVNREASYQGVSISNEVTQEVATSSLPTLTEDFAGIIEIPENVTLPSENTIVVPENSAVVLRIHANDNDDLKEILGNNFEGTNAKIIINDVDNKDDEQPILVKKEGVFVDSGAKVGDINKLVSVTFEYLTKNGWREITQNIIKGLVPVAPNIVNQINDFDHTHLIYTFNCWNINEEKVEAFSPIHEDTKFVAKYDEEGCTYNVHYYLSEELESTEIVGFDSKYTSYKFNIGLTELPTEIPNGVDVEGKELVGWKRYDRGVLYETVTSIKTTDYGDFYFVAILEDSIKFTKKLSNATLTGKPDSEETFLFRIGNENNVSLSSLFDVVKTDSGRINMNKLSLSITPIVGNASGIYTASGASWEECTIKFSGLGTLKVTLKYDNRETDLYLEVVNGVNVTKYTDYKETKNNILLNNVDFSGNRINVNNHCIYGNGFMIEYKKDIGKKDKQINSSVGFITLNNGSLENLIIKCPVFDNAIVFQSSMLLANDDLYYNVLNAVEIRSGGYIKNCYISGGRCAIFTHSANLIIEDSIIEGGALANISTYEARKITLKNITTIQKETSTTNDPKKKILGLGIFINNAPNCEIEINGYFNQYNWLSSSQYDDYVKIDNTLYASLKNLVFSDDFKQKYNNVNYINTGIVIYDNYDEKNIKDYRANIDYKYYEKTVKLGSDEYSGGIYTIDKTKFTIDSNSLNANVTYTPTFYTMFKPTYTFDNTANYKSKDINPTDYCEYKDGVIIVGTKESMYTLDLGSITNDLGYQIELKVDNDSAQINDKKITFDTSEINNIISVCSTVNGKYYGLDGKLVNGTTVFTYDIPVRFTLLFFDKPSFVSFASIGTNHFWIKVPDNFIKADYKEACPIYNGIIIEYYSNGEKVTKDLSDCLEKPTLSLDSKYWITKFSDNTALEIYANVSGYKFKEFQNKDDINRLYFYKEVKRDNKDTCTLKIQYIFVDSYGQKSDAVTKEYSFRSSSPSSEISQDDFDKGKYTSSGGGCVTSNTPIMMSDGSTKLIKDISVGDMIMTWSFEKGCYEAQPVAVKYYHGDGIWDTVNLQFSDNSVVCAINEHGFYDLDRNAYSYITPENYEDYIGHRFAKLNSDGTVSEVTLIDGIVEIKHEGCYSLQTAFNDNFVTEGILSITAEGEYKGRFEYFKIGEDMKYIEDVKKAEIEKYGLFTPEEFAQYLTTEEFYAFNGPYLKVLIGRGVISYDDIIEFITDNLR